MENILSAHTDTHTHRTHAEFCSPQMHMSRYELRVNIRAEGHLRGY